MIEAMDTIVLDAIDKNEFDSFKDYKKEMEDFTFKSIFGGE